MNRLTKILALSLLLLTGCTNSNNTISNSSSNQTSSNVNSTTTSTSSSSLNVDSSSSFNSNNTVSSTIIESTPDGDLVYEGYYKATYQNVYFCLYQKQSMVRHIEGA